MRTNSKLSKRDPQGMHPLAKSIGWSDNEAISHLHKMFCIECHLGLEPARWIYQRDLNALSINVLPNDTVHLLLVRQEMAKGAQGISKAVEPIHQDAY